MTRQKIGKATGISPATVSNLVGDLLDQGVIVEAGAEDSDGGRPRMPLRVKPEYRYVVGVDVGETAILVELFDLDMQVERRTPSPRRQIDSIPRRRLTMSWKGWTAS